MADHSEIGKVSRIPKPVESSATDTTDAPSYVSGLVVTRPTAATLRIRCTDALLRDASNDTYRTGPVDVTVNITAAGANGLDEGSEAADTFYSLFLIYNGTAVAGIMAKTSRLSGTTTSTTADKLVDSGATFSTDNIQVGAWITNTTDNTRTRVSAVDSETQLSVEDDIFASGEGYEISNEKPELPAGYTYWSVPVSFALNDASSNFHDYRQDGDVIYHHVGYTAAPTIATGFTSASYAFQDCSAGLPVFSGRVYEVWWAGDSDSGTTTTQTFSIDGTNKVASFTGDSAGDSAGHNEEWASDRWSASGLAANGIYIKTSGNTWRFKAHKYRINVGAI